MRRGDGVSFGCRKIFVGSRRGLEGERLEVGRLGRILRVNRASCGEDLVRILFVVRYVRVIGTRFGLVVFLGDSGYFFGRVVFLF